MNINFELYKVFYFVAKTLSFSEAAHHLYISQSAVSQSIQLLEGKMDTKLFFRHSKMVKLTSEGEVLFKHIEQAFNFIKSGERSIRDMHSLKQGEVRIGASDTISKYYLLPYFKKFHQTYPNIKIHVVNRPSPICTELLTKGYIDIAIVSLSSHYSYTNLQVIRTKKIQDVFIAGSPFLHLKNKKIALKELSSYPLLLLEKNAATRNFFDTLIEKNHVTISPEIELESIDLLVELAKIGLGISFVMKEAVEHQLVQNEIFILNIKEEIPTRSIGILIKNNLPLSVAAKKFTELLCL